MQRFNQEIKWVAWGKKGEVTMYDWIKDKKFLGMMRSRCAEIVN